MVLVRARSHSVFSRSLNPSQIWVSNPKGRDKETKDPQGRVRDRQNQRDPWKGTTHSLSVVENS